MNTNIQKLNPNSYGVSELNNIELRSGIGGFVVAMAIAALAIAVLTTDWDQVGSDFMEGYNSQR